MLWCKYNPVDAAWYSFNGWSTSEFNNGSYNTCKHRGSCYVSAFGGDSHEIRYDMYTENDGI